MTKNELRRAMREKLALDPAERAEKSARLCAAIAALPVWREAGTVVFFAPQTREPDVELLWPHADGKVIAYPRVEWDRISLRTVTGVHELHPAEPWGLREPSTDAPKLAQPIDVVLVPGVAFSRNGARCGRGGGFYDRLLSQFSPEVVTIGVCYGLQIFDKVPMELHDRRLSMIVTEDGLVSE